MAILTLETPVTSTTSRQAPATRKTFRNHSGSLSDSTASTASSSSSSSLEASSPKPKSKSNRRRRGRGSGKNKNQSNNIHDDIPEHEQARYLALDCEMVGIGPYGRQSALARVSLVDWNGRPVLDEYVRPDSEVTDYRTYVSGITPQHLAQATYTAATIRPVVRDLLQDRILVGHGLKADLHALDLHHPWYEIRDTAKYEPFMQTRFDDGILWPRKLKDLCATRQVEVPVDFQQGSHCSVADALAALRLYQSVRSKWEK
eukprot:scaffold43453_cov168-Amphora_coffeaeformis.AAC.1